MNRMPPPVNCLDPVAGKLMCLGVVLTILVGGCASSLQGQLREGTVPHFLERAYIFGRLPVQGLLFEAQLVDHIFVFDGLPSVRLDVRSDPNKWHSAWRVSFTPMIRLRVLNRQSRPVRTPSFMPRPLDIWSFHMKWRATASDSLSPGYVRMWAFGFTPWAHHSNGQEGCTFTGSQREDGTCGPFPESPGPDDVNRVNGDFSTNFLRLGTFYKRITLDNDYETRSSWTFGAEFEVHPCEYGPGGISAQMRRLYGNSRVRLRGDVMGRREFCCLAARG